jgi:hypothetical protein
MNTPAPTNRLERGLCGEVRHDVRLTLQESRAVLEQQHARAGRLAAGEMRYAKLPVGMLIMVCKKPF